jgi:hypothetical protein
MSYHRAAGRPRSWPRPVELEPNQKRPQNLDVLIAPDARGGWLVEWYDLDGNVTDDVRSMRCRQWHTAQAYALALLSGGGG